MLRKVKREFKMALKRGGGSIIGAEIDVWRPTPDDWELVSRFIFNDVVQSTETINATLPAGAYTCVFQGFVTESINGRYDFNFLVAGKSTFISDGDVDTTPAKNDKQVFKDQFVLEVS
jgi:hypothetical protein